MRCLVGIITLVTVPAAAVEPTEVVRASSGPAVDAEAETWLRVGDGVGEAPGESRPQICSSSSRPAVDDE